MNKTAWLALWAMLMASNSVNSAEKIKTISNDVSCTVWETLVMYYYNKSDLWSEYICMDSWELPEVDYICWEGKARVIFEDIDHNNAWGLNSLLTCVEDNIELEKTQKFINDLWPDDESYPKDHMLGALLWKQVERKSVEDIVKDRLIKRYRLGKWLDVSDEEILEFIRVVRKMSSIDKKDNDKLIEIYLEAIDTIFIKKYIRSLFWSQERYEAKMSILISNIKKRDFVNNDLWKLLESFR